MTTPARLYHTQQTHYLRKGITFNDIGNTVDVGVLPAGAIVVNAGVVVSTAFNSGTTDVLDIGTSADTDGFATDIDLRTAGKIAADELATSNDLGPYAADTTIQAVLASTGTAATAGAAEVFVEFIPDNDR
jgi:hypothetical protein